MAASSPVCAPTTSPTTTRRRRLELCERAAATARARASLQAELAALDALSWSQANLGRFDDAIETLQNGVAAGPGHGSGELGPRCSGGSLSWYLWSQGRYPAAVEAARAAMRYIRRPQVAWERAAWLAESLAEALISHGEWDDASRVLDEAVGLAGRPGCGDDALPDRPPRRTTRRRGRGT